MAKFDPNNIKEGPGKVYKGPVGAARPADSAPYGDPGVDWEPIGMTQGGFTFGGLNAPRSSINADHQRKTVKRLKGNVDKTLGFNLLETDMASVFAVSGEGELDVLPAGESAYGHTEIIWNDADIENCAILVETVDVDDVPWRAYYAECEIMISGDMVHRIGQERVLPVTVTDVSAVSARAPRWIQVEPPTG